MVKRLFVVADVAMPPDIITDCRALSTQFADYLGEPVGFAVLPRARLRLAEATLLAAGGAQYVEELQPPPRRSLGPMAAADFVWREDGRPDWAAMWTGFCELALYGGPPHRGEDDPVAAPAEPMAEPARDEDDPIAEIQRGIWETTGLVAEPAEPGWIAVSCNSRKMAAWLCATVILENVEARFEGDRLFLPAGHGFTLKDQVKSVITVLAKTNHYWQAHVLASEREARAIRLPA